MAVQITIGGVPEEVRDELATRAALVRQSLQEFLRSELERIASRPSRDAWLQRVQRRKALAATRVLPSNILVVRFQDNMAGEVSAFAGPRRPNVEDVPPRSNQWRWPSRPRSLLGMTHVISEAVH